MGYHWNYQNVDDPNHPAQYDALPEDLQDLVRYWIDCRIEPAPGYYYLRGSYGLKHDLQRDTGLHISNGSLKGAMLAAGFRPKDEREQNCVYKIRQPRHSKAPIGWWAKEHGFHVVYDSAGRVSVTRGENGAIRPP